MMGANFRLPKRDKGKTHMLVKDGVSMELYLE